MTLSEVAKSSLLLAQMWSKEALAMTLFMEETPLHSMAVEALLNTSTEMRAMIRSGEAEIRNLSTYGVVKEMIPSVEA